MLTGIRYTAQYERLAMVGGTFSHYRLLERLGSGGMGAVYKAEDLRLGRTVALKVVAAEHAWTESIERFRNDARAALALDHPTICPVYDIDQTDDGFVFIAMALCNGQPLSQRLASGPLPVTQAIDVAAQIAEGLSIAHARGIIHRDVKPSNVMLAADGSIKIVDFGLAKNPHSQALAEAGASAGMPTYMSPEQIHAETVDVRTDLWSLGVVLYEMLAGRPPFVAQTPAALVRAILCETPPALQILRPGVPMRVVGIVKRLTTKQRQSRYATAAEVLSDLRAGQPR